MSDQGVTQSETHEAAETVRGEIVTVEKSSIQFVEGDTVHLSQCDVEEITANSVEVREGAVRHAISQQLTITEGGILKAEAGTINVTEGGVGIVSAQEANLNGPVMAVYSQTALVNENRTGILAAREVRGEKINTVVLLAGEVHGNVETVVSQREAALFGIALGAALGIVIGIFRWLTAKR